MRIFPVLLMLIALSATGAERSIDKSIVVPATLDQAWDAWTTREGIISFFAPDAKVEPKVGGVFQVYVNRGSVEGEKRQGAHQSSVWVSFASRQLSGVRRIRRHRTHCQHRRSQEAR